MSAHFVDVRIGVVLLLPGGKPLAFIKDKARLCRRFALLRLRDRRDELGGAPALEDLLGGLALSIEFPVPLWVLIRRVQNGPEEEVFSHGRVLRPVELGGSVPALAPIHRRIRSSMASECV